MDSKKQYFLAEEFCKKGWRFFELGNSIILWSPQENYLSITRVENFINTVTSISDFSGKTSLKETILRTQQ